MKYIKKISLILILIFFYTNTLQSAEEETFTIASCNILSESPYQKFIEAPESPMPLENRIKIIQKIFQTIDYDIICLQECNTNPNKEFGSEYQAIKTILKNKNYTVLDSTTAPKNQQKHYMSTAIAYKTDKFIITNPYTFGITKQGVTPKQNKTNQKYYEKICTSITLKPQALKDAPPIKIINWHLPPNEDASKDHENIQNIIKKHAGIEGFTIVCGDFNYNSLTEEQLAQYNQKHTTNLSFTTDGFTLNTDKNQKNLGLYINKGLQRALKKYPKTQNKSRKFIDAAQHTHNDNAPTAYHHGFNRLDYIFYTNQSAKQSQYNLECTNFTYLPHDLKKLIKHTQPTNTNNDGQIYDDNENTGYFSDHATIVATFEITQEKKAVKEKLTQKLLSIHDKAILNNLAVSLQQLTKP